MTRANHLRTGARAGALGIAMTGAALASGAAAADSQDARLPIFLDDRSVVVGETVLASGRPGREFAGRTVVVEHRTAGSSAWTEAGRATVDQRGVYRFRHRFQRPGALRAVLPAPEGTATTAAGTRTSRAARVSVAPRVAIGGRRVHVRSGRRAAVSGRVSTGAGGVRVMLELRRGGRWATLDRARTGAGGRFRVSDRVRRTGSGALRLTIAGHAGLSAARRGAGRLHVYRVAQASWYGPGLYGNRTGCGGTLYPGKLGVAHKTLPCGARVTFRHRGRTVTVPVIDRGPYVGGREYDLTEATARKLRFGGHGAILASR